MPPDQSETSDPSAPVVEPTADAPDGNTEVVQDQTITETHVEERPASDNEDSVDDEDSVSEEE